MTPGLSTVRSIASSSDRRPAPLAEAGRAERGEQPHRDSAISASGTSPSSHAGRRAAQPCPAVALRASIS